MNLEGPRKKSHPLPNVSATGGKTWPFLGKFSYKLLYGRQYHYTFWTSGGGVATTIHVLFLEESNGIKGAKTASCYTHVFGGRFFRLLADFCA
jgi:hypothetical protein